MEMRENRPEIIQPSQPESLNIPIGFAIAGFILGVLAIFLSILVIGIFLGIAGIICSIIHLKNTQYLKTLAVTGIILSAFAIILSITFGTLYYTQLKPFLEEMASYDSNLAENWKGKPAPDFKATTLDGQDLVLSELKGKTVILNFWATWCPPCVKEIPHFIRVAEEIPEEELLIIGISDENMETVQYFAGEKGINYPLIANSMFEILLSEEDLINEDFSSPYDQIFSIPTTFFIDQNGIIQDIKTGYLDYETLIKKATAEYTGSSTIED